MKRAAVANQLQQYRLKRNFVRTPEPTGRTAHSGSGTRPIYVVQKHAATRLHYDFRLELDGTLKSWAVPKGPSLDPGQKRLAVHVEDHPLEYADFEGTIPPKQYGAGTVLVWDRGTWRPEGNPGEGYRRGVLKFRLDGQKLRGAWTLVRMHRRGVDKEQDKDNWLLIKERDAEAKSGEDAEIVERLTDSVQSGRGLKEVASKEPRVWQSDRRTSSVALAKPVHVDPGHVHGAMKAAQPDRFSPQLATLVDRVPTEGSWLYEIKYDGYRILCRIRKGDVRLFTRNGNDWTAKLQAQADAVASLGLTDAWLDGEVVVFTKEGKTSFQALQNAFDSRFTGQIVYCLFDLLYLNGYDLRSSPLSERKRLLASLLAGPVVSTHYAKRAGTRRLPISPAHHPLLRYSDHIEGQGQVSYEESCRQGLEG
jgi:bifunctional non-homologous end joining protein LigD